MSGNGYCQETVHFEIYFWSAVAWKLQFVSEILPKYTIMR